MRVPELEHVLHHGTAPILGYKVHRAVTNNFVHLICSFKLPVLGLEAHIDIH